MHRLKLADIALILAACFFFFLFVYSVLNGKPQDFTFVSRSFFAVMVVALLLSIKIPSIKAKLAGVVYSSLLALFLCETLLMVVSAYSESNPVLQGMAESARHQGLPFDTRSKVDVINDYRTNGLRVYPNFVGGEGGSERDRAYLLTGLSKTPTVVCNDQGKWIVYQTDEKGFNNPADIWGSARISLASIGDSFTWGSCVDPELSTPGLLRHWFPDSLNLGVAGTGPLKQLAIINEYLEGKRPEIILWFYWEGNDLRGLRSEYYNEPVLRKYLEPGFTQNLLGYQSGWEEILRTHQDLELKNGPGFEDGLRPELRFMFLSKVRAKIRNVWYEKESSECIVPDDVWTLFQDTMVTAKGLVESWGGESYFIYLPSWTRYSGTDDGSCKGLWNPIYSRDAVIRLAEEAGYNTIDISEVFMAHPDPISLFAFRADAHYNENGYKMVADTVLKSIEMP